MAIHQSMMLALALGCLPTVLDAADSGDSAHTAFEQLTSLIGTWEGAFPDGRRHTVSYRLTAAGSVLVETWTLGPNRESMTLYSIDGSHLIATHFCPQGNQPRLRLVQGSDSNQLTFEFLDGTNLQVQGRRISTRSG